jgi:hypothetical protein
MGLFDSGDNMSCQSYSVAIEDSGHFEQIFGTQKNFPQTRPGAGASGNLLLSTDMSKKAV